MTDRIAFWIAGAMKWFCVGFFIAAGFFVFQRIFMVHQLLPTASSGQHSSKSS